MKTQKVILLMLLLGATATACQPTGKKVTGPSVSPNVIIVLADDMGYGDPEVNNDESKIPTPHINALAASGMRFTEAHSPSSVCTPTRYGILTGRYAWRSALKRGVLRPWDPPLIEQGRTTMATMLKDQGYHTACIGKWHLGWRWPGQDGNFVNDSQVEGGHLNVKDFSWKSIDFSKTLGGGPLEAGFDYYFGDDVPNYPPYIFFENNRLQGTADVMKPEEMFGNSGGPMQKGWDLTRVMPTITSKAVSYIQEQKEKDGPFFLYFPLTAPHTPIAPDSQFVGKSQAGRYGDYVHQVDYTVGQIVAALEESGQLENTILIFTSDNGSPRRSGEDMSGGTGTVLATGHDPSRPWTGMKADIWEGGHHVPFMISWPAKIKAGSISDQLFGLNDLMASIAALSNASGQVFEDSFDFSQVWLGEEKDPVRSSLVHHSIQGMFAIRKGPWKLIAGQGSGGWSKDPDKGKPGRPVGQLYNMDEDPGETRNLYDEKPGLVAELSKELKQYQEQGYSNPAFKR